MALPFTVLGKPTGAECNLDCSYCFFLSKDQVLSGPPSMSYPTLETYLHNYLGSQPDGDVTVAWQGGEPTLRGIDFFRTAFSLAEQLARPAQRVTHSLQTNGTLLTREWAELLAAHQVLVGISIDGPADLHDAYRVNKAGRGSHSQVIRGWEWLQEFAVPRNILCTVHHSNEDHPLEVYRYFRDTLGAEHMQFIPIVERTTASDLAVAEAGWKRPDGTRLFYSQVGDQVTSRSVSAPGWGRFLRTIFDEWAARDIGQVFVQQFDVMLGNHLGIHTLCVHSPTCGNALVATHDGDIYSCDHYVEPQYRLGNVTQASFGAMVESAAQRDFSQGKSARLPVNCRECPVLWACHGGCPKDRFLPDAQGGQALNYLCAGYTDFFTHATPLIESLSRGLR